MNSQLVPAHLSLAPLDHELVAKFDDFIARFSQDSALRDRFLADPAAVLAAEQIVELSPLDAEAIATIGMQSQLLRNPTCDCRTDAGSDVAPLVGGPPPFLPPGRVPAAFWWGVQIPISRAYISYVLAGHATVAVIAGLAAAAFAAAGIALGIALMLAFAAYMIAQILVIVAVLASCPNSPGIWFSMLWAVPGVFVPTCI